MNQMFPKMLNNGITPPSATQKDHQLTIHQHTRVDPYFWLNERENPDVEKYLEEENAYVEEVMAPLKDLRQTLFAEMKSRIKEDDQSVPYKEGNYLYYTRFVKGGEYPVYCRKKIGFENEEIIIDGNELAKDLPYFEIGGLEISDNENLALVAIDSVGRRNYTLRVKDLITQEFLNDQIEETEGGNYAWCSDNKTFYYIAKNTQTLLGDRVFRHTLGTDKTQDQLVFTEKDNQYYMGLYRMKSKKYIAVVSEHIGVASEYQLIRADDPQALPKTFLKRGNRHEYSV